MKSLFQLTLFSLLSSFAAQAVSDQQTFGGWIVGKDYLLEWNGGEADTKTGSIRSHSFDSQTCQLWVGKADGSLELFTNRKLVPDLTLQAKGRLVSPLSSAQFFFHEDKSEKLQVRNGQGGVEREVTLPNLNDLVEIRSSEDKYWALFFKSAENKIWITKFDSNFKELVSTVVATANTIWANPKFHVHSVTQDVWVGYTTSGLGLSTTPMVKQFNSEGKAVSEFAWMQRGLFFDLCEEKDHLVVARDLPTPPFTVPVYSFLDELFPGEKPKNLYELPMNYLVDSLHCSEKSFWIIQRSIFGSDGSYLVGVNRSNKKEEFRTKLPGAAEQIYRCE